MKNFLVSLILVFSFANSCFAASRYISLAPSTTEILFALGLDDEIVGVSTHCNYPDKFKIKPKIGDFSSPNIEKIFSLKPDYIFCTGLEQAAAIQNIKKLNLNIYVADPANFDELFLTILDIGKITNRLDKAQKLVDTMKKEIDEISLKVKLLGLNQRKRVFIEIWHEPLMTAGKGSFIDELLTLAGGVNVAHEVIRPYCNFSSEKVVELNPDVVLMAYMDKQSPLKIVETRLGWKNISAVKNKKVFNDINPDLLLRPGPRIVDGLKEIYKRLYE